MPRVANRGRRGPRGCAPRGARAMLRGVEWGRGYHGWAVGGGEDPAMDPVRRRGSAQGSPHPGPCTALRLQPRSRPIPGKVESFSEEIPAWSSPA